MELQSKKFIKNYLISSFNIPFFSFLSFFLYAGIIHKMCTVSFRPSVIGICFVSLYFFFEIIITVMNSEMAYSFGLLVKIIHTSAPRKTEVNVV